MSGINRDNPRTDSMYYGLDADTGKAVWFSLDHRRTTGRHTTWALIRNTPTVSRIRAVPVVAISDSRSAGPRSCLRP